MRIMVLVVITAAACGPSKEKVNAERAALAVLCDQLIAGAREQHACDAERKAYMEALDESLKVTKASLYSRNRDAVDAADSAAERAKARQDVCEKLVPTWKERADKITSLHDAWIDACLECATGRACIDADRKMRREDRPKELSDQVAFFEKMKAGTVCDKPQAR